MKHTLAPSAKMAASVYDFRDPVHRMVFEGSCAILKAARKDPRELASEFVALDQALATGMRQLKRDLAASTTCWGDASRAQGEWICGRHLALADLAAQVTASVKGGFGSEAERELRLGLHALRNVSEAAKWQLMVFATRARAAPGDDPVA